MMTFTRSRFLVIMTMIMTMHCNDEVFFSRQSLDWEMFESLNRPDPPAYGKR